MKLYEELASKYDIDGLHLDYLRYEVQSPMPYGYDKTAREDFMEEYGIDPILIDRLSQNMYSWNSYRERLINTFVQELSLRLRAIKPDLLISAAVGSDPTVARVNLLQNWPHWADNGWVDFLTPMSYTANTQTFRKLLAKEKDAAAKSRTPMAPGIGLHLFKTDAEKAAEQLNIIKTFGFAGSMLFASAHLTDETLAAIAQNVYAEKPEKTVREAIKHRCVVSYVKPTPPPLGIPENVLPVPSANVPRTAAPIEVDGGDSDWSSPRYVTIGHDPDGNPANLETKAAMCYDDEAIYFLFVCSDPKVSEIKRTVDKRDGPTFYEDSAEVFIDTAGTGAVYYHLSTNTLGTMFDQKLFSPAWNGDWKTASKLTETGWITEIAVPYSVLGVERPKPGDEWRVNLNRNATTGGVLESFAWSVPYGSFHSPDRFGKIIFE